MSSFSLTVYSRALRFDQLIAITVCYSPQHCKLCFDNERQLTGGAARAIVTSLRAGRTNREISDFNNIPYNTVKGFAREYHCFLEEGGDDGDFDIKRKQHRRRSDAYGTEIVAQIQAIINDDPGRSMRKIAVDLNIAETTVRKIVKEEGLRRFAQRDGQEGLQPLPVPPGEGRRR